MTPVWLLDIDGVINACTKKPDPNVWPKGVWHEGKADVDGHTWPILWAQPVIDFIRDVHETGKAEIRWHTTWQHDARVLAELVGLPEFAVADAPEYANVGQHAAKATAAGNDRRLPGRVRPRTHRRWSPHHYARSATSTSAKPDPTTGTTYRLSSVGTWPWKASGPSDRGHRSVPTRCGR